MNLIKTKFGRARGLFAGLAFAALAMSASAQLGTPTVVVSSGTNCVLAATQLTTALGNNGATTTSGALAVIDCTQSKELSLEYISALTAAGTTDKTLLYFYRNLSGSRTNYETTAPFFIWGITPNGTTPVVAVTNITTAGAPFIICALMTNGVPTTAAITNFTLRAFALKR